MSKRSVIPAALAAGLFLAGCSASAIGDTGSAGHGTGLRTVVADARVDGSVTVVRITGNASGFIKAAPGDGTGVGIHRTVHYRDAAEPNPTQQLSGGVLTFEKGCADCYIDYELTVPATARVEFGTASGDIEVRGVSAARLESASGAVTGTGLGGAAETTVESKSGSVALAYTGSPGSVSVKTLSGGVRLGVPGGPYRVEADTTSGRRSVTVPTGDAGPLLAAHSLSGDVEISGT